MPMSSTSRYGLAPAPGLTLLQDLVNTRPVPVYGVPDLLATPQDAADWLGATARAWTAERGLEAPDATVTDEGLAALRGLRDAVDALLAGDPGALPPASTGVAAGGDGLRLEPQGSGASWLASAVAGEALLAQQRGDLGRLKTCRNRHCPCAFWDRSRNNSRVWHDVHTCGNVANLRASRARRRAT